MIKPVRNTPRPARVMRSASPLARSHGAGARRLLAATLERRLHQQLQQYTQDTPEGAFPSFLESLHCDSLK